MSAKYDLYRNPDPKHKGELQPLHARFVPDGLVKAEEFYHRAAYGTTFNPGEIKAAMGLITETLVELLNENKAVELGEIGTVTIALQCPPVMDKNEIRSVSVEVKNMNLRLSKAMKTRLASIHLERSKRANHSEALDEAKRDAALETFFATNAFITRAKYQHLRSCCRTMALKELNALIAAGKLKSQGIRANTVYLPVAGYFGH